MNNGSLGCVDNSEQGVNNGRFWDDDNSEKGMMRKRLGVGYYSLGVYNGSLGHKLLLIMHKE
ncbi:MAG: hypothetical protein ACK5MH_04660 [Bacteroidales bacterium]